MKLLKSVILLLITIYATSCINKSSNSKLDLANINLLRGDLILCSSEPFGEVNFSLSCNFETRETFNLAVALLHSFEYAEAEKAFVKVIDKDPDCVMAYWGVSMSIFHSLWMQSDLSYLEKGEKLLKIANALPMEDKEKDYLDAIGVFYKDWKTIDQQTRKERYEKKMEALHYKYKDDVEASVFYALALRAAADSKDKTYSKQIKSGKILEKLFVEFPNHPGMAHYIIHNYDYPELAHLALNTARRYAQIAPASSHAQHMPSHIFTRLGLWQESINSNLQSTESALCYAESINPSSHWDEELHGMDYLVYAYLQLGDNTKANQQYNYLNTFNDVFPINFKVAYSVAAIPTRIALENKDWIAASHLQFPNINIDWETFPWQKAMVHFGRSLGFSNLGDVSSAEKELEILNSLHQKLVEQKDDYKSNQVFIQINTSKAWIELAKGESEKAISYMLKATQLENNTSKHAVTPCEVLPADELLGDLYLKLNMAEDALMAYETSIKGHPNRFNSIYGAAIAAKQLNNQEKMVFYFQALINQTESVISNRPEILEAKNYLNKLI